LHRTIPETCGTILVRNIKINDVTWILGLFLEPNSSVMLMSITDVVVLKLFPIFIYYNSNETIQLESYKKCQRI
jgi:hypothetical protein